MKKEERQQRFALTLLVTVFIFFVILLALLVGVLLTYFLMRADVIISLDSEPKTWQILLFTGAVSLIVGLLLTGFISRIPLKPVNRFINQMNRLAAGDFSARLRLKKPFGAHPTVREISKSFNTLAEELENTELLRRDFVNNFSHEFKTPIMSIAGFAKLLRKGNLSPAQQEAYLSIIEEESLHLSAMATNILHMTKVENQTILTDVAAFNLSEQLRHCILLLQTKWERKNIDFSLQFGEVTIRANRELLQQVWVNLLDNAIKFSPAGSTVTVSIAADPQASTVAVKNTGPAIEKEKLPKIWNKFYQADESHAGEGNGIGLALVRRIVRLHGGTAAVASEDGATVFSITLPTA